MLTQLGKANCLTMFFLQKCFTPPPPPRGGEEIIYKEKEELIEGIDIEDKG